MKSDRPSLIFSKVMSAIIAFFLGAGLGILLSMVVDALGIVPQVDDGGGFWRGLFGHGVKVFLVFGLSAVGGIVAAAVSWLFHPTVTLRVFHVATGLFVLAMGIGMILVAKSLLMRFLWGPIASAAGAYVIWTAAFGKRSDVEDL